jgi:F420-non-reducing hydrogenase small subunit
MDEKPKISFYWTSSCGGCEISLVNLHERLLDVDAKFALVFCPCLMDGKKAEVEALDDGAIAVSFLNGAIATAENEEMAVLLRRKSRLVIAYGACAVSGGIPALANLRNTSSIRLNYIESASVANGAGTTPRISTPVAGGELVLPALFETIRNLASVIDIDYSIPGCPPEPAQVWAVLDALIRGTPLPPQGSVLASGVPAVCTECSRAKHNKRVGRLYRSWEIIPDTETCLLEQGLVCAGAATRSGCGALCPAVNVPCTGCYGPPEGVADQGARMLSALCSVLSPDVGRGCSEEQLAAATDELLEGVPDPAGTLYRFSAVSTPAGANPQ